MYKTYMRARSWYAFVVFSAWGLLLSAGLQTAVRAHGALPISQEIMWRGDTMLVPAAYWGLFLGSEGRPWRWICEEAINANQSRQMALISDGTLYATDRRGVSVSRDGGCSWAAAASGIDTLQVLRITADPFLPRAWVLGIGNAPSSSTGLWYSDDAGMSWQLDYAMPDHLPSDLRISADGRILVIGSVTSALPRKAVLHVSDNAGTSFAARPLNTKLDGQPLTFFTPTFIDAKKDNRLYLHAETTQGTALLQVDGTADPIEILRTPGAIMAMSRTPSGDKLLLGTKAGLFTADGDAPFAMNNTLRSAQCFSLHQGILYACAWNYTPDRAAIARLSEDVHTFTKVFQFDDTQSPLDCPADTSVSQICPMVWANYAEQLGVQLQTSASTDANDPPRGCSCAIGTVRGAFTGGTADALKSAAALLVLLFFLKSRRPLRRQAANHS